jgi:hypothetical protein
MIFSDRASPAKASSQMTIRTKGFAQAENRYPRRIKSGAGFFGIKLDRRISRRLIRLRRNDI